jgi:hypothetical protein
MMLGMDQKKAHIENLKKIKNKKYFLILYIIEMDVEKDGKIFMGVGIGVGLIITIIGGSYLLQEKKNSNHNNHSREETVSHRGEILHERLLRSTNANERLDVYKNTKARGNKTKKHDKFDKHHKHKSRKHK